MFENLRDVALTVAAVAVVLAVMLYASEHVTCFNFFGITKGCVTH